MASLLSVENLQVQFQTKKGINTAVDGVSFSVEKGRILGIVGESGCGKSVTSMSILQLLGSNARISGGSIKLDGKELIGLPEKEMCRIRGNDIAMIFQDPMASLNPRKKVIDIVAEGLDANHMYKTKEEREQKVFEILEKVGLNHEQANRYPHMFSGGQRQRVGIARAMVMEPEIIIADECISALDVSIQAQVVNIMKQLQEERGLTYLFIAHDLAMVKYISDYIGVIHLGHFVEMGTKDDIFNHAIHPYTRSLLSAIPEPNPLTEPARKSITYDKNEQGVDYTKGIKHQLSDTHMVLATNEELSHWMKEAGMTATISA